MTGKKQAEQKDELRDLDVREEQAEEVKGGSGDPVPLESVSFNFRAARPRPAIHENEGIDGGF